MLRGQFSAAWEICDRVLHERLVSHTQCHTWPRHLQFIWNGDPVDGKRVFVRCYHGLGDTIQFARLLAPLRKRARHVALWVQPALIDLLANIEGVDELHALHDGKPELDYDVDIELMELPHVLRLTLEDLPGRIPYLQVPPSPASPSPPRKRIGIAWRSGDWNASRSIPDALIEQLADIPQVTWSSLQYNYPAPAFMNNIACKDIRELAARMRTLDLIISVDTMIAHLAGALALPTWTLLSKGCDWRWMCERADSPWYPTMRLIRQQSGESWNDVVARVAADLRPGKLEMGTFTE
jgi:hypothetical protein